MVWNGGSPGFVNTPLRFTLLMLCYKSLFRYRYLAGRMVCFHWPVQLVTD